MTARSRSRFDSWPWHIAAGIGCAAVVYLLLLGVLAVGA